MITSSFEYLAPSSLGEALELLDKYGEKARILAGGQSLIPVMNLGLASPSRVLDINRIKNLAYITEEKDRIVIGSLTRHYEVAESRIVRDYCPMLAEAAKDIGDMHVKHRGTIGGAVCHADPAGDYLPVLTAADAEFEVQSQTKKRILKAREFFQDTFTTALYPNEILTSLIITRPPTNSGSAYAKLEFVSGGFAIVGAAAYLVLDSAGNCERLEISVGGVESKPLLLSDLSGKVRGKKIDSQLIDEVGELTSNRVKNPLRDIHADGEYRKAMVRVFVKRAVMEALTRAKVVKHE